MRRARWAANASRIDELRTVLDEAAVALDRANRVPGSSREEGDELVAAIRVELDRVSAFDERLAVRLGEESPIVKAYHRAHLAIAHLYLDVRAEMRGEDAQPWDHPERLAGRERAFAEIRESRRVFREASSAVVGPSVPSPRRRR